MRRWIPAYIAWQVAASLALPYLTSWTIDLWRQVFERLG